MAKGKAVVATDGLRNLFTGMGTEGDARMFTQWVNSEMDQSMLDIAYRNDWIARKIIDLPAQDATREWRGWEADQGQITKLEELEKLLNCQQKLKAGLTRARLYGGAALVMGIDQGNTKDPVELDRIRVGDLKFLHVVSRHEITAGPIDQNIDSPFFGEPSYYQRSQGRQVQFHPSRVVRLVGMDRIDNNKDGWGDPVLQAIKDAIKACGSVSQNVAALVDEAKVDVISIPELNASISDPEYEARLKKRFGLAATAKSVYRLLLLDKEENWQRITQNFTTLPDILKMYLLIATGAADIPATRFLGQSPAGLSATGESDLRNYYDRIGTDQKTVIGPALNRLDEVLIRSALGNRPPDLWYDWNSLWQLDDTQKAALNKTKAETYKVDVDTGLIDPAVLSEARMNQLIEDGVYPGIEQIAADFTVSQEEAAAALAAAGTPPGGEDIQKSVLNGAQITSVVALVTSVAAEEMPPESAKAIIAVGFPDLSEAEINAIIDPLKTFTAKPKPAPIIGGLPGHPPVPALPGKPPAKVAAGGPNDPSKQLQQPVVNPKKPGVTGDMTMRVRRAKTPVADATPRSMYVYRPVLNWKDIAAWAKKAGFKTTVGSDMHVTLAYSPSPVDWMKAGEPWGQDDKGNLTIKPGGARLVEKLGNFVTMMFSSSDLTWRWCSIKESTGASWKWPDYQPHVTITKDPSGKNERDLLSMKAYQGQIVLGPEVFEEVKVDWSEGIVEDAKWSR